MWPHCKVSCYRTFTTSAMLLVLSSFETFLFLRGSSTKMTTPATGSINIMQIAASLRKHSWSLRMEVHWVSGHGHLLMIQTDATVWYGRSEVCFSFCTSFACTHVVRIPATCSGRRAFVILVHCLEVTRVKYIPYHIGFGKTVRIETWMEMGRSHFQPLPDPGICDTAPIAPQQKSAAPILQAYSK